MFGFDLLNIFFIYFIVIIIICSNRSKIFKTKQKIQNNLLEIDKNNSIVIFL